MTNISSTAVDKKEFASIATKEYSQVTSQVPEVHENVVKDNVQEKHKEDEEEKKNVDVRNKFGYEDFFSNEIEKKKLDHTYRVFRRVSRCADQFPMARECPEPGSGGSYTSLCLFNTTCKP